MTDFDTLESSVNSLRTQALIGYVRQEFDKEQMLYAKYDVINFAKSLGLPPSFIEELNKDYSFEVSQTQEKL